MVSFSCRGESVSKDQIFWNGRKKHEIKRATGSVTNFLFNFVLLKTLDMVKGKHSAVRRPVFIADYRSSEIVSADEDTVMETVVVELERTVNRGIRFDFPEAGSGREGGDCDGYCYRIVFSAGRLESTYDMVRAFLSEQGYDRIPIPETVTELKAFRLPPKLRHQLSLFGEDGYVHNPVKILFPSEKMKRGTLVLELYNEQEPGHLLRFHHRD